MLNKAHRVSKDAPMGIGGYPPVKWYSLSWSRMGDDGSRATTSMPRERSSVCLAMSRYTLRTSKSFTRNEDGDAIKLASESSCVARRGSGGIKEATGSTTKWGYQ